MRNIAIFGGAFDPIHWGHLLIAETALDQLALDEVIWVPTFRSPHKRYLWASFPHRLEMIRRAIADQPAFTVSDIDAQQGGISYAIATLQALKPLYPNSQWYWIIGIDAFQNFPQWHSCETLAPQCIWLVAPRHSENILSLCQQIVAQIAPQTQTIRWHQLHMPWVEISSSQIRESCQMGKSIRYLVTETVREYITVHKLYTK